MDTAFPAALYAVLLFIGMAICLEIGRRIGLRKTEPDSDAARTAKSIVDGAFFGLFSLLIAFSFAGATSRFDHRRELIIEEANDIGTAYLRVDLLPPDTQPAIRDLFRQYVAARIAVYQKLPDIDAAKAELAQANELQGQIWSRSVAASALPGAHDDAGKLLPPALNAMIDITNTRTWAARTHPPRILYGLLFLLGLVCAGLAGQSLAAVKPRAWSHMFAFAFVTCVSIFVILEIEYPRMGFIGIQTYDQALVEVLDGMK
jgi:hypothetical protein